MSAQGLLEELARLDVTVKANGENLSYNAPKRTVTPELRARLREHKVEILDLLRTPPTAKEDHKTSKIAKTPEHPVDRRQSERPCHHGVPGGCWLCKKYGLKPPPEKTVSEILKNPPYWMEGYISGFLRGHVTIEALAWAVAAAIGRSPYEWGAKLLPEVAAVAPTLLGEKEGKIERMVWA